MKHFLQPLRWALPALLLAGFGANAQAPANDNCPAAVALTPAGTCVTTAGTLAGATQSIAPILCAGFTSPAANDVWYRFTATASAHTITANGAFDGVLELLSGTCTTLVNVGCSDATTTGDEIIAATGLTVGTTYYARFYGYGTAIPAAPAFTICVTSQVLVPNDASLDVVYTLGKVSSAYGSPHVVRAVVTNRGSNALTNKAVTLTVAGATTFTNTQTIASLASGASTTVTFAGYPVTGTTGTNTLTVSVPTDDVVTNNTKTATQLVTAGEMSYNQGTTYDGGVGIAAANSVIVARHTAVTAGSLNTVTTNFNGTVAAATYQVVVYDAAGTGGTPGAILYTSATRPRPAAGGDDVVTIPGIAIPAGSFFVGIKAITATNVAISYQTEVPLRSGVFLFTTTGGTTWTDVNTTPLNSRLAISVILGAPVACPPLNSLTATGVTATGATLNFTAGASATSYAITVTPQGGPATTQTATASPVTLSGLSGGTSYTVSVVANCGPGQTSTPTTVTFTTTAVGGVSFGGTCALALPIPDGLAGTPGVLNYPIVVSGVTGTLRTVDFIITHTWDNDLEISLISPGGQTVILSDRKGGSGDNYGDATNCPTAVTSLADANTAPLSGGTAPFTGPFAPDNPLSGFTGTANGTWIFRVSDNAALDTGTLEYVKLTFNGPATCNPVTALTAASANNGTRANVTFTPSTTATTYTVTYQQQPGGAVNTVTPNPTASPVAINALTPNTTYLITVISNCAGGLTSATASTTVRTVLAAREALGNGYLTVFPNPTQGGAFTVALPALAGERTANVTLLNALGQTVYTRALELNAAGTQARVDVSGLAKGMYTLRVKTSNQTATKAVVVD